MRQHPGTTPRRSPARGGRVRAAGTGLTAALALGLATLTGPAPGAQAAPAPAPATAPAADNPYERGPDPTEDSVEAPRGHYDVAEDRVSSLEVSGFGGGTVYYPTETSDGTFGAVAVAPGYTADQSSMAWYGPRLASRGFVVFTIDTLTRLDQPASRGRQLLAALDYLTERSSVRDRIDASRLGVMGHSMGGGGSLEAAVDRPSLEAAIPLTPWNLDKTWRDGGVPTLIVGADGDSIAPVSSHAEPFYEGLPGSLDRAYLELNRANHFAPNSPDTMIAKYSISWLKRFIDDDTRYEQFLCPIPGPSTEIEEYRGNCPHGG
ncbi:alpha/beta hydrolase [Streptomyces sp. RKND-216]|uniref:bis(hydroxyethyl) terephthalate hydrolase n=1 Tax=Streptomyces sp. RKND-216 TaxID=2562581 RepID=UPI00109E2FBF|nr:alpha/beta hydrolase [Streptomyces sp. RKND-216]THA26908.1 alpha/beta hydrolase [Streptomyces sp. RKND-216]